MAPDRFLKPFVITRTFLRKRFRLIVLAPVLAIIALSGWAFASPMGSSPDDDFHLVSTWCSTGNDAYCQPGATDATRIVPYVVLKSHCFAFKNEQSAACQDDLNYDANEMIETRRGNFAGAYPPLYYSAMSVFVGDDPLVSVMAMRIFNVIFFVGLTTALYLLLPVARRSTLVWGWLITTMPLGVFLLASNNPSGWAVVGVGSAWLALLGLYEATTRAKQFALGGLVVVTVLMAAGSRGDSAVYVIGAMGVAAILAFENTRKFWTLSILPSVMAAVALVFFFAARQTASGISGFGGSDVSPVAEPGASVVDSLAGFGLLAYNLLSVPSLWLGAFGSWAIGWIDTPLPVAVMFFGIAAFIGVGFLGLGSLNRRKAFVIASVGFLLWILPTYVLTQGGHKVGEQVQPRYILPLIVLFGGLLVFQAGRKRLALGRAQSVAVVVALSAANLVSLHMNIRRYVTGIDVPGWNLNTGVEWFWAGAPSPMVVWIVGSLSFAGLVSVLVREMFISACLAEAAVEAKEPATPLASR